MIQKTGYFLHHILYPSLIWKKGTYEKIIYLTFDDGPIPEVTEWVLEQLSVYEAKATFFCVGDNIRKHPEIFKKIIAEKHKVGNHTFNHLKGWSTNNEIFFGNIEECQKIIVNYKDDLIQKPLFRPPHGQLSPKQIAYLKHQYDIIMWHVLTMDYDNSFHHESCLKNSLKYSEKGSIVVFHDSIKAYKNLKYVLPRYLAHFKKLGYSFHSL